MPFLDYNENIPDAPNNPSNDQPLMKTNTNSISTWTGVDHFGFENNLGGYHTVVHLSTQGAHPGADPAPVAGTGEVYTKTLTAGGDTALFFQSASGKVFQLTTSLAPSPGPTGYTFLLGNIRLMWGSASMPASPGSTVAVSFTPAFTTAVYSVNLSIVGSGTRPINIQTTTLSTSGFTAASSASSATTVYWMAIGV